MNLSTFFIRLLQLALVGLFVVGLFAVGFFVFLLTFGVIAILGAVYWLRSKGIIKSSQGPDFTENGAEYYMRDPQVVTEEETPVTGAKSATIIDADFKELDDNSKV